ncbi:MAG TPA: tyrosine-type recombinase/integrase [Paenalcaligenes sp.]|nr:tyrosine-type recombinase/integrase [Paenalcaligenes sp.]
MSQDAREPHSSNFAITLPLYESTVTENAHDAAKPPTTNRVANNSLLKADNDLAAVQAWLAQYLPNSNTFNSYRKEAERLLLWMQVQGIALLADLKQEHFLRYRYFLSQPQPAEQWLMPRGRRLSRQHPDWRPFAGPLSESSIHQSLTILNSLMQWLVMAQYLQANPLALLRHHRRQQNPAHQTIKRYIPTHLWQQILKTIGKLPINTPRQKAQYHRARWIFSLFYATGLRVSEVCEHSMGDFYAQYDPHGNMHWWLSVRGKGNKERSIPITTELMRELGNYRRQMGLCPTPQTKENTPLVLALDTALQLANKNQHSAISSIGADTSISERQTIALKPLTRASIHYLVKDICQRTADRLRGLGSQHENDALLLEQASPHWLRHTAGTHMVENNVDILHVRDTMGHSSLQTTNRYLHTAERERHAHTEQKHHIGWPTE